MMRGVRDEGAAYYVRSWRAHHDFGAEAELPRGSRLLPRHLLKNAAQLSTQFIEETNALFTGRKRWRCWPRTESVEFFARAHHQSEARKLREMRGQLAERARLGVWTPVVAAVRDALEHAARRGELRLEIGEKECNRLRLLAGCGRLARRFSC